jgi:molybdopterin converting factor small subunit
MAIIRAILANGSFMLRARINDSVTFEDIKAHFPEAKPAIDYRTFNGDAITQAQISFEDAKKYGIKDGDTFNI